MKQTLFLAAVLLVAISSAYAEELEDVVYLKNGGVYRGIVVEQIPGESLTIQTNTGGIVTFSLDEVARITKENPTTRTLAQRRKQKSTGVATALSIVFPGAGQHYLGAHFRALLMEAMCGAGVGLVINGGKNGDGDAVGWGIGMIGVSYLWSIIDAPLTAESINNKALKE